MNKASHFIKPMLAWAVVCVFLSYIIYFFYHNPARLQQLASLSITQLVILLSLSMLAFSSLAGQLKISLIPYLKSLSWFEALQLSITNNLLNYFPLKSGAIAKGLYLKSVHRLALQQYLLALFAAQLLWILVSAIPGLLVGLYLVQLTMDNVQWSLAIIIMVLGLAMLAACGGLFSPALLTALIPFSRLKDLMRRYAKGINDWRSFKTVFFKFSIASMLLFAFFTLRLYFVFSLGGQSISIMQAIFLQSCVAVGFAFSFVPGNLGLKEGMLVGVAVLLGLDAESAMLAALLDRAGSLLPTLLLGPFYLHSLTAKILTTEHSVSP